MIDRSYLPFQSARDYVDVGMQKWMGFFLSEHSTALSDDLQAFTVKSALTLEQKLLLLSQLYSRQLRARIRVLDGKTTTDLEGTIPTITKEKLLFKTEPEHVTIPIKKIIAIELIEEVTDESIGISKECFTDGLF